MKIKIVLLIVFMYATLLHAQIEVGAWRTHFSYRDAFKLLNTPERIYCLTSGGLYYFNKTDNSINTLTTLNGLTRNDATAICHNPDNNTTIIGYTNGSIDIIKNGEAINLTDIARKINLVNKRINNLYIVDELCYAAAGFGVVVFNYNTLNIKDTWYPGENGSQTNVNELLFNGNSVYAATDNALLRVDINNFPAHYSNWTSLTHSFGQAQFVQLMQINSNIYCVYITNETYHVARVNGSSLVEYSAIQPAEFIRMAIGNNRLYISKKNTIETYNLNTQLLNTQNDMYNIADIAPDSDGSLWMASQITGLQVLRNGNTGYYLVNAPYSNYSGNMVQAGDNLWVAGGTGSVPNLYSYHGFYRFSDEKWTNYYNTSNGNKYPNISYLAVDPYDNDHIYGSAKQYGLVEFNNEQVINTYNTNNSELPAIDIQTSNTSDIRIQVMKFDKQGNLWIVCRITSNPIVVLSPKGEWYKPQIQYPDFGSGDDLVMDLIIDEFNNKWLLMETAKLIIFRETDNTFEKFDQRIVQVSNQEGEAKSKAFCLNADTRNTIWVGTNEGPVRYYAQNDMYSSESIVGNQPKIPRNDGTPYADFLLSTVAVTDVETDGANRMWFATTAGVFLISEDGQEQIKHFTIENSPLPTNNISSIGIQHKTGEVFFGTGQGIVSYRSNSTKGNNSFGDVYVFPNPVRPGYTGVITITGLAQNANVKITDISGNLVYETTALGAQASWDGYDVWGNKVNTGVYMVFCTNEDASETHVTKFVFVK